MRLLACVLGLVVVAAAVEPPRRVSARAERIVYIGIDQTTGALTPVGPLSSVGSPVSVLFMDVR